ncbi:FAD-dependent monooxygenase [Hymenobacter sp. GOD-10R]|uniref:FAD-dependent monooxygenase n=1 Tax=Hymenobacter sp. GOD-10R TaxID=3093922 RepID=UPI002D77D39C|nr:FAD-dependent monooxygenase [Hymenobacter sp. GOD-10R]WRQ29749.1 FAD-dependent monooxygenase [Hymenobacter sp. GOD-10R]
MNQQSKIAQGTLGESRPVLIIGAGPTGMTAAMELARFGVPVRLIDKMPTPSTTSRALAVQARTLELLEQRGLTQQMLQVGNRGTAATLYSDSKRLGRIELANIPSRYNYILLISQAETERLLREHLAQQGVVIERGTELVAFSQIESASNLGKNAGVRTVLRNQAGQLEELDAAYAISAEGAHSLMRRTLNLEFKGKSLPQRYAVADLYLDSDLPDNELSIFLTSHGFLAVFPMGNRHFRFIASDTDQQADATSEPTLAELQRLYDTIAHRPGQLHDLTWSSRFYINSRMLDTLRERRIFFGGDSAHIHSPAGGQGMNTGIQDMIDLGWKLALVWHGKAAPELLDTYAEERLPVIRQVVARTETATDIFNSTSKLVHQLLTLAAPVVLNAQFIQELSTGLVSEVTANYRASALSRTRYLRGELRAGDRMPDFAIRAQLLTEVSAQSHEATLQVLLDPACFTLFVVGDESKAALPYDWVEQLRPWQDMLRIYHIAPASSSAEATAQFKQAFGGSQSLLLVRPDAYLGFVGGQHEFHSLLGWFQQWFPAQDVN